MSCLSSWTVKNLNNIYRLYDSKKAATQLSIISFLNGSVRLQHARTGVLPYNQYALNEQADDNEYDEIFLNDVCRVPPPSPRLTHLSHLQVSHDKYVMRMTVS